MNMVLILIYFLFLSNLHISYGGTQMDSFWINEAIERHNLFRKGFNSPPLKLNNLLCKSSQDWADFLASKNSGIYHSTTEMGENIFFQSDPNSAIYGSTPVDAWFNEQRNYDSNFHTSEVGSFTQVVWKETKEICVSYAKSADGNVYIVAHYLPKGNGREGEAQNVTPDITSRYYFKSSEAAPHSIHFSKPIFAAQVSNNKNYSTLKNNNDLCLDIPSKVSSDIITTPDVFMYEALRLVNSKRKFYDVPPLFTNKKICKSAQLWANQLGNYSFGEIGPSSLSSVCAENFHVSKKLLTPLQLIEKWSIAPDGYDSLEHLIWKNTKKMCVAYAKSEKDKNYYYVAFFYKKGNYALKKDRDLNLIHLV